MCTVKIITKTPKKNGILQRPKPKNKKAKTRNRSSAAGKVEEDKVCRQKRSTRQHVKHAPPSEIYSQMRAGHTLARDDLFQY